ncbi:MAG: leucyl/phenylalanyl-tRNA--protein transferase [Deltaproteobacteria bacterium]|nr:leucyl/phenylalanyl-tRNA--protein transferase [Deltaproteobacteria bacterium]
MPIFRLSPRILFPSPALADSSGLLAVGGDLSPKRLVLAYASGIFPWYSDDQPLLWWSPDPRMVLHTEELHVHRSLAKRIRRGDYAITMDRAFDRVIRACAEVPRPGQGGTWITEEMMASYQELHRLGYAHSVEAWRGDALVGGLYGVAVGRMFAGESMFAHAPDASKVAFAHLVAQLHRWDYPIVDAQMHTEHLARFGARLIPRSRFLEQVSVLSHTAGHRGRWEFDEDFAYDGRAL